MREVVTGIDLNDIDLGQSLELSEAARVELLGDLRRLTRTDYRCRSGGLL
ncbi:hypothetical protein [Glycomyces rhizosphaerae]|uniref:FXSXX-COOH protein n=1 Tax=Glycomyces rhizosphaerae TaxID=2054422 RepID=A0ABV7Q560_9ACTN